MSTCSKGESVKHRKKVISNRSFAEIWTASKEAKSFRELCNMAYESKHFSPSYLDKNNNINLKEFYILLENIYMAYNMSFKEIMSKAGVTNSMVRDLFCIPEKSIEAWKSGRNKCPDYVRLMMLRYYHLINLGKYIYSEDFDYYINTIPKVYTESTKDEKRKYVNKRDDKKNSEFENKEDNEGKPQIREKAEKTREKQKESEYDDEEFEELLNSISVLKYDIEKGSEQIIKRKENSVVKSTNYLDDILKNRKNPKGE